MKHFTLSFLLAATLVSTYAQNIQGDTINHVHFTDKFGNGNKALVVKATQVLIVDGDSIYTVSDEFQLRRIMESRKGFNIINNPDSVGLFMRTRIKAIVILKKKN